MTGSLGTTSTIYHQLDSASDSGAPACCTNHPSVQQSVHHAPFLQLVLRLSNCLLACSFVDPCSSGWRVVSKLLSLQSNRQNNPLFDISVIRQHDL
jgi:hypothetical protein